MYDRFGLFLNGTWTAAQDGRTAPVFSPVSEQALGKVPVARVADTEAAIASAAAGFVAWKARSAFDRADSLHAIADEMKLKAGMVGINSFAMAASEAPFGGTNHSGMGREGGPSAIRDYLDIKSSQMVWA